MNKLKKNFSLFFAIVIFCSLLPLNVFAIPPAGYEQDVIVSNPNPFSDTDINSLEGKAARYLYNNAIIGGFPDGEFKGHRYVNRAELAKFLLLTYYASLKDIESSYSTYLSFSDMLEGQWYVPYVNIAAVKGVISGYPDGSFKPDKHVNTVEFLKMISLMFKLPENLPYTYQDVDTGAWYAKYVGIVEKYNLFPNRKQFLKPSELLTRNEVAVAFYQLLSKKSVSETLAFNHSNVAYPEDGYYGTSTLTSTSTSTSQPAIKTDLYILEVYFLSNTSAHKIKDGNDLGVAVEIGSVGFDKFEPFDVGVEIFDANGIMVDGCSTRVDLSDYYYGTMTASCGADDFPSQGNYTFKITIDSKNVITEYYESNNIYKAQSFVGGYASAVVNPTPSAIPVPITSVAPTPSAITKIAEFVPSPEEKKLDESIQLITTEADITAIIGDEKRKNIYALAENFNELFVIDEESMDLQKEITVGSKPRSIVISKDGAKAYIATAGQSAISVVDLNSLERLDDIKLSIRPHDLAISSKYLYVTHADDQWGIGVVVDLATGKEVEKFGAGGSSLYSGALLQISADEKYLYLGEALLSPANIYKFDISGVDPVQVARTDHGSIGSNLKEMVLDSAGERLFIAAGAPYSIQVLRTSDLKFDGVMDMEPYPLSVGIYEKEGIVIGAIEKKLFYYDLDDYSLILSEPCNNCIIEDVIVSESKGLLFVLIDITLQGSKLQGINVIDFNKLF